MRNKGLNFNGFTLDEIRQRVRGVYGGGGAPPPPPARQPRHISEILGKMGYKEKVADDERNK